MAKQKGRAAACMAVLCTYCGFAHGEVIAQLEASRLSELSLEELANIQVTSVSKRPERLSDAAASVFVITAEDIRRSGATTLPEALRLAPNLQLAQSSASSYAVTARGMNGSANSVPNKLLVLIDGRSVYSPFFSGVFWDVQNPMLENIERIEVISGPGSALWGVNAVNGVINIITRKAQDTQGTLVSVDAGNRGGDAAARYGGRLGEDGSYRISVKHLERNSTSRASGAAVNDAWHTSQAGFRADWDRRGDRFTIEGNAYRGTEDQPAPGAIALSGFNLKLGLIPVSGANVLGYWQHALEGGSSMSLQAYFDRTSRTVPPTFAEDLDIADIQFQHSLRPIGMHTLVWGLNTRYSSDHITNSAVIAFLPPDLHQRWNSLFAQDEMALRDDLRLTLGARMERNDYTGNEFLPTVRLAWKPSPERLLWGAVSRTVRAPTRLDHDAFVPGAPPFLLAGGSNVVSEVAKVFELGYRAQLNRHMSYSVTAFHNIYTHLRTQEIDPSRTFVFFSNQMEGRSTGLETWGSWQVTSDWRLSGGLTALREKFSLLAGSNDPVSPSKSGLDPAYTAQLRASHDLSKQSELDLTLRRVAKLSSPDVPAYTALDLRYGWKPRPKLEVSVIAQNLLGAGHAEYGDVTTRSTFDRYLFVKLVAGF
jgi:iron complex outermembrane receptor protein